MSAAEAQQATGAAPALAPVTVTAPVAHHRHVAAKPTKAHLRARTALRHKLRETTTAQSPANPGASAAGQTTGHVPGSDPYANPNAPYQAERFSSSKFSEPIFNTPRSVTVLTQQVLQDENATSLRDIGRTTAGVTLGSGEGGNAFGDRSSSAGLTPATTFSLTASATLVSAFARISLRKKSRFCADRLRAMLAAGLPAALSTSSPNRLRTMTFTRHSRNLAATETRRFTFDVNKAISPILDVRLDGLIQGAGIAGRDFTTDDRNGLAAR
ncbi:MAG: TonB-dependent receptor plug domain-containing protein [Methylovirgula sp.]